MQLLCDRQRNRFVTSLSNNQDLQLGPLIQGESIPITAAVVDLLNSSPTSDIYGAADISAGTLKIAVGRGFALPVAGSYRLIADSNQTSGPLVVGKTYLIVDFIAGDNFTNVGAASNVSGEFFTATGTTPTTWTHASVLNDVTAELAYNDNAAAVQSALNALPSIFAVGGVTVGLVDGFFTITGNEATPLPEIYGDASNLAPLSIVDTGVLIPGSIDPPLREVQTFQLLQDAGALATLDINSDPSTVGVDPIQVGGGGLNAQFRISLDPLPNNGTFTLSVRGLETGFISFQDDGTGIVSALEGLKATSGLLISGAKYKIITFVTGDDFTNLGATSNATGVVFTATGTTPTTWTHATVLSPVGAGNVQVSTESATEWLVMFTGDMANTDMGSMAGSASGLLVMSTKSGVLDLDTAGIDLILGQSNSVTVTLEAQYTPMGGKPQVVAQRSLPLNAPIIRRASSTPTPRSRFYTQAQVDALLALVASYSSSTFSTAGTTTFTKSGAAQRIFTREINLSAGAGTYTRTLVLDTAGAVAGDIVFMPINFPASTNPTVTVRDATSGGTILYGPMTAGGTAYTATPGFYFNGTAWKALLLA